MNAAKGTAGSRLAQKYHTAFPHKLPLIPSPQPPRSQAETGHNGSVAHSKCQIPLHDCEARRRTGSASWAIPVQSTGQPAVIRLRPDAGCPIAQVPGHPQSSKLRPRTKKSATRLYSPPPNQIKKEIFKYSSIRVPGVSKGLKLYSPHPRRVGAVPIQSHTRSPFPSRFFC